MTVEYNKLDGEPIIILTYGEPFAAGDLPSVLPHVVEIINAAGEAYVINDLRNLEMNFGNVVMALGEVAKLGDGGPADPRAHHILIGDNELVQFSAESLHQQQYGGLDVKVYTSLDDALAYARQGAG